MRESAILKELWDLARSDHVLWHAKIGADTRVGNDDHTNADVE